jgi:hypothetical protein
MVSLPTNVAERLALATIASRYADYPLNLGVVKA